MSVEFVDWHLPDLSWSTRTPLCISIKYKLYIFCSCKLLAELVFLHRFFYSFYYIFNYIRGSLPKVYYFIFFVLVNFFLNLFSFIGFFFIHFIILHYIRRSLPKVYYF